MVSLRLITTGLDDVHSVIGYELDNGEEYNQHLIQPRDGSKYNYEAMHDINGISIPQLLAQGEDRESSLRHLLADIEEEPVLVWYKPFVSKFIAMSEEEIGCDLSFNLIDLYALAKQKGLNSPSFKLADVYDYTGTDNLFDLKDYLDAMPEPKRIRRV